jgi:hypothetical protein
VGGAIRSDTSTPGHTGARTPARTRARVQGADGTPTRLPVQRSGSPLAPARCRTRLIARCVGLLKGGKGVGAVGHGPGSRQPSCSRALLRTTHAQHASWWARQQRDNSRGRGHPHRGGHAEDGHPGCAPFHLHHEQLHETTPGFVRQHVHLVKHLRRRRGAGAGRKGRESARAAVPSHLSIIRRRAPARRCA